MSIQETEIDQLIRAINIHHPHQYQSIGHCHPKSLKQVKTQLPPVLSAESKPSGLSLSSNKFLTFKPWSGTTSLSEQYISEPIREQIENENEYEDQKQDYMLGDSKILTQTNSNEIGYFYKFVTGKVRLIKCLLDENGFRDCYGNNKNWSFVWSSSPFKMDVYRGLMPYQKANHFPNSFHLTRKDLMNKTISKMQVKYGITHYNFLPKTYILPQQLDQLLFDNNKHPQTYIIKPHNRSQGKGITVTSSLETIYSKLEKYSSLIVSHYINNPLLINKLKFDLRIYVAITSVNPLRIYVYDEGLARFATEEYDASGSDSENKKYQHLTNYSVNKKNAQFVSGGENEEYYGSKWSLTAMKQFLFFNVGRSETNELFERIDEVIVKTILSAQNLLYTSFEANVPYINGCFEVLGFDVMIDSNLKPWLIEVNHSPSMNTDSSLDLKIKGNMISDLFTMVGVTPLGERYLDGGHSKYESRHYFKVDSRKGNQSAVDKFILKEVEAENERRGDWKRVFPSSKNIRYKTYFESDRYYNRLLREKLIPEQHSASVYMGMLRGQYRSNTVEKSERHKNIQIRIARSKIKKNPTFERSVNRTHFKWQGTSEQ